MHPSNLQISQIFSTTMCIGLNGYIPDQCNPKSSTMLFYPDILTKLVCSMVIFQRTKLTKYLNGDISKNYKLTKYFEFLILVLQTWLKIASCQLFPNHQLPPLLTEESFLKWIHINQHPEEHPEHPGHKYWPPQLNFS